MTDFINELKNKKCAAGEKLEAEALIIAQKVLCNMGLDFIPPSYVDFMRQYNGVKYDGSFLFGATVDDDLDIIDKNEQINKPDNTIVLGCNDFDLLCYDFKQKKYLIIDRSDFKTLSSYSENERDSALYHIFKI